MSTSFQTAWAILGAAIEGETIPHDAVGIAKLIEQGVERGREEARIATFEELVARLDASIQFRAQDGAMPVWRIIELAEDLRRQFGIFKHP